MIWLAERVGISVGWRLAFAPSPDSDAAEIDWIVNGPWGKFAVLITAAIAVLTIGNVMMKRRARLGGAGARSRGDFDLEVARMAALPITPIAQAQAGPVHLEVVLVSSNGSLGGAPGHECVWRNRYGASRNTAVGAELVVAEDASGEVGLEGLERARVLAPKDPGSGKHEFSSLYVGDRVEVVGYFSPERHGDAADPRERVYGIMGAASQMQVKVLERPSRAAEHAPQTAPTAAPDDPGDPL